MMNCVAGAEELLSLESCGHKERDRVKYTEDLPQHQDQIEYLFKKVKNLQLSQDKKFT